MASMSAQTTPRFDRRCAPSGPLPGMVGALVVSGPLTGENYAVPLP